MATNISGRDKQDILKNNAYNNLAFFLDTLAAIEGPD